MRREGARQTLIRRSKRQQQAVTDLSSSARVPQLAESLAIVPVVANMQPALHDTALVLAYNTQPLCEAIAFLRGKDHESRRAEKVRDAREHHAVVLASDETAKQMREAMPTTMAFCPGAFSGLPSAGGVAAFEFRPVVRQDVTSILPQASKELLQAANSAWNAGLGMVRQKDVEPLGNAKLKVKPCQVAGFCLCGDNRFLHKFEERFVEVLKLHFPVVPKGLCVSLRQPEHGALELPTLISFCIRSDVKCLISVWLRYDF